MISGARWKSIAYVSAIFLVGGVTGASIAMSVGHWRMDGPIRGRDMIQHLRGKLQARLDLTPEQVKKINPIVEKLGAEMRAIHLDAMQRTGKLMDNAHDQIAAELTPEQKRKLERFEQERHESMRERHESQRDRPPFPPHHGKAPPGGPLPPGGLPPRDHRPPPLRDEAGGLRPDFGSPSSQAEDKKLAGTLAGWIRDLER